MESGKDAKIAPKISFCGTGFNLMEGQTPWIRCSAPCICEAIWWWKRTEPEALDPTVRTEVRSRGVAAPGHEGSLRGQGGVAAGQGAA